ncbi:MAG: HigA family addiction module antitoxin [Bryobacteraceae bacterium]|jgi:addiction module HigA family antidote
MATKIRLLEPIHPGEILYHDFMAPLGISINRLARDLDVPPNRISQIVRGKRALTADTALRLGRYFRVSPEVWLNLQVDYEMRVASRERGKEIQRRVRPRAAA